MKIKYVGLQPEFTGYGPEKWDKRTGELLSQPFIRCHQNETVDVDDDFGTQLVSSGHFEVSNEKVTKEKDEKKEQVGDKK